MKALRAVGGANLLLILSCIISGVGGQVLLKKGADNIAPLQISLGGIPELMGKIAGEPFLLIGLPFFITGAVLWLVVLSRLKLSHAYPFLGLNYVLVTLMAVLILGEQVDLARWLAVGLIIAGVVLAGQSEVVYTASRASVDRMPERQQEQEV